MSSIADPATARLPRLILKSGRDRSILNRHPWIFSGAVKSLPDAQNGDVVLVTDNKKEPLGYGFYNPKSQIICRLFEFDVATDPAAFTTQDYWTNRVAAAYQLREKMVINSQTNAYRLLHAEGDGLPGLIADCYDKVAVLQPAIRATDRLVPLIVEAIKQVAGTKAVYIRNKQAARHLEELQNPTGWHSSQANPLLTIRENGLQFRVDVENGQKTGFFIDQRDNRQLLQSMSKGRRVLNTFCYTGGFSVYALAGGAQKVVSVDISEDAVAACQHNVQLNFDNDHENHAAAARA